MENAFYVLMILLVIAAGFAWLVLLPAVGLLHLLGAA